jgi:hypothetical protein
MYVCAHHECIWQGRGRAALIFNLSTAWRSASASCLQPSSPSGWAPGTHWIGRWVHYPQGICAIFFWGINVMDFEKVTNCGSLEFWTTLLMCVAWWISEIYVPLKYSGQVMFHIHGHMNLYFLSSQLSKLSIFCTSPCIFCVMSQCHKLTYVSPWVFFLIRVQFICCCSNCDRWSV